MSSKVDDFYFILNACLFNELLQELKNATLKQIVNTQKAATLPVKCIFL